MKGGIIKILCVVGVCALLVWGTMFLSGDWEEIHQCTAYYYPEEIFYDLNGTPIENTGDFLSGMDFNAMEYNAIKIKCDIYIEEGEIESLALEDKDEQIIRVWTAPITSFEEDLDKDTFRKIAFVAVQGSKGTQGQVVITLYGRPKLITNIKREISYIKG